MIIILSEVATFRDDNIEIIDIDIVNILLTILHNSIRHSFNRSIEMYNTSDKNILTNVY